ncbi:MAG: 6-hydroxymethylpterin diphosphokinase MptE-like protein [Candidatus Heimdallarchaeaceae archaeon]
MIFDTKESIFNQYEKKDFTLNIWLTYWYPQICNYLEIDSQMDHASLETILTEYSSNYSENELKLKLHDKDIFILAPGIYMEEEFDEYLQHKTSKDDILICIDGATSYAISRDIIPDLIVTDFDGKIEDQISALEQGSTLVVHSHGDNLNTLRKYLPELVSGSFIITTQIKPLPGSSNFLGFTDGDRAVCLATMMSAKSVFLLGFDLSSSIGSYSKPTPLDSTQRERKLKKFKVAKSVVNWCVYNGQKIYFYKNQISSK